MAKLKAPAAEAENTTAGGYLPQFGEVERANHPRLIPRPPFLLTYHPERWTVMHGMVIPLFGSLKLQAGVNRIRMTRDGRFMKLEAQASLEEQGWTVIPADVDGPNTSYMQQAAPGIFVSRWERCFPSSSHVEVDEIGYAKWCRSLIDRNVIPRPATYVLELLRGKRQHEHDDLADKVATSPSLRANVARCAADLQAIDAELARYGRGAPVSARSVDVADLLGSD